MKPGAGAGRPGVMCTCASQRVVVAPGVMCVSLSQSLRGRLRGFNHKAWCGRGGAWGFGGFVHGFRAVICVRAAVEEPTGPTIARGRREASELQAN